MSNILKPFKRAKRAANKIARRDKAIKRFLDAQKAYFEGAKEATQVQTVVIDFCDNGKTKPACNRCPVCLGGFDVEKAKAERELSLEKAKSEMLLGSRTFMEMDVVVDGQTRQLKEQIINGEVIAETEEDKLSLVIPADIVDSAYQEQSAEYRFQATKYRFNDSRTTTRF
mgnify:CR=1 FL=1